MRVAVVSGALVIAAAGCGATPARTEQREQPGAATATVASGEAAPAREEPRGAVEPQRFSMLDGRFSIAGSIALGVSASFGEHPRLQQAYETTIDGCPLVLVVRSAGLVRPEGPVRFADAEERAGLTADGSPLEIVTTPMRRFESLAYTMAGPGAVVFERDGTATDIYTWAQPTDEELDAVDDEGNPLEEPWRQIARLAACLEPARRLRDLVLSTLRVEHPFVSANVISLMGDDREPIAYGAALPAGWVLSYGEAYDAEFIYVHRRLPWREQGYSEPTPAAQIWEFVGDSPGPLTSLPRRVRTVELFGRQFTFHTDGCAHEWLPSEALMQSICLTGSDEEREAILGVLSQFRSVSGPARHPAPRTEGPCLGTLVDDSDVHVRAEPRMGARVLEDLPVDSEVTLVARRGRFWRIESPLRGWVHDTVLEAGSCALRLPDEDEPSSARPTTRSTAR